MPAKKYQVVLTDDERHGLEQLLRRGKHATRTRTRARIVLKAADGLRDEDIAEAVETSRPTVERTRKRFATARLAALTERPRPGKKPVLDAHGEAQLIAEACRHALDGRQRWTLRLLAGRVVALGVAETCSADTVRRVLKKTCANRG
jgi:transposase